MKRPDENVECYLCGVQATTWEHVPPKNLSPKSSDSNFIRVPACEPCNSQFSHQESKFRDLMATAGAHLSPSATDAWQAALRNFGRSTDRRSGAPSVDILRILNNIDDIQIVDRGKVLETVRAIKHPADLDSDMIAIKIAKGLHFQYGGGRIKSNVKAEAFWVNDSLVKKQLSYWQTLPIKVQVGDFFQFIGGFVDNNNSFWILSFYTRVVMAVTFMEKRVDD